MPYTVNSCFETFRSQFVDLDADDVVRARSSREYLQKQLAALPNKVADFPPLNGGYVAFGSFARRTKTRPLDDIDMLLLLNDAGISMLYLSDYSYLIQVNDTKSLLWKYTNDTNSYLNSTKILNKIVSSLREVSNYRGSRLKRTGVAAVLDLISYPWAFDIVPAFPVVNNVSQVLYYLIPDGKGNWMKTDPRRDQTTITNLNQRHNGKLIPLMRLMKYWNNHYHSTRRLPSYYFETILINGFNYQQPITSIKESILLAFQQLSVLVLARCPDPKNLGRDLDADISWETKTKVQEKANEMTRFAQYALYCEQQGNHKEAIKQWQSIFYPEFPGYGL